MQGILGLSLICLYTLLPEILKEKKPQYFDLIRDVYYFLNFMDDEAEVERV